ncbi:MAG: hypothetical protein A2328_04230 [Bdellovibrionales bacterium RIFOXYB2_FULL_36_6]|nr:MAG: hypothetical protein A2328_04230 [Bdellovibrionales bacterium RIFOXYB2_FULL_36_6]
MRNILFVVPHVPMFDTNAGDWRTYCLCRILAKRYNVFLLPRRYSWNDDGYEKKIEKCGIKIVCPGKNSSKRFEKFINENRIETVIFRSFYMLSMLEKHLPLIRNIIIDTQELHYEKEARCIKAKFKKANIELKKILNSRKTEEIKYLEKADVLIAISEVDAKKLRKMFPSKRIAIIPLACDTPGKALIYPPYEARKDIVFFGFFEKGNPNNDAVSHFIRDILPLVRQRIPGIRFNIVGSGANVFKGAGNSVCTKESIKNISSELSKCRVFVCPLRFGAGVKKKVLDSMISRTPVVSTNIGIEGISVISGKEVLVADSPAEFANKVIGLYQNRNLWDKVSSGGYSKINRFYSEKAVEKQVKMYYDIFETRKAN